MSTSRRDEGMNAYAYATVCTLALIVGWVLSLQYVPPGWPLMAVDGVGYMLSVVIMAGGYSQLKRAVRTSHAVLITVATWLIIALLVRTALLALFGHG